MQENYLIEGLNPLSISTIRAYPGRRYKRHPMWRRLARKKHPWKAKLGCFELGEYELESRFYPAHVSIFGSNGKELRCISCRSNAAAKALEKELDAQLNQFLGGLVKDVRSS